MFDRVPLKEEKERNISTRVATSGVQRNMLRKMSYTSLVVNELPPKCRWVQTTK